MTKLLARLGSTRPDIYRASVDPLGTLPGHLRTTSWSNAWSHLGDHAEEKVIFIGDAIVANEPPFLAHADIDEWIVSLEFLQKNYKNFSIISGRGGPIPTRQFGIS
jgi:hypothetical protein